MLFSKKWLQNHPQFLLHFLIHIDVLMLCRKFDLISIDIFQVMAIIITNRVLPSLSELRSKLDNLREELLEKELQLKETEKEVKRERED